MEDYIYILAAIAWVVYAFYKNSKKGRKKVPGKQAAPSQSPGKPRDFKSVLEEMLMGEQRSAAEETPVFEEEGAYPPELRPVEIDDAMYEEPPQKKYFTLEGQSLETLKPLDVTYADRSKAIVKETSPKTRTKKSKGKELFNEEFDLRKAVIYSVLLDRPYK